MQSYGFGIDYTQLAIILLANIDFVPSKNLGCEFHPAMLMSCHKYAYKYMHNPPSITDMLKELVGADGV